MSKASSTGIVVTEDAFSLLWDAVGIIVSMLVIKGLMEYVRKHSFAVFGIYRIVLGIVVLAYFALLR